jgi:alpha-tubulin suppressor-like RCC1 family protein
MWVAAGPFTTGVITEDDHVYLWGKADDGALGIGPIAADDDKFRSAPGSYPNSQLCIIYSLS